MISFLYRHIIKTNVFISICAVAIYFSGLIRLGIDIEIFSPVVLVIFLSTYLIYNISQNKFGELFAPRADVKKFLFIISAVIVLAVSLFVFDLITLIYFVHLGIISLLYNSPLLNNYKYLPLRSIPLIKVFLIAYIWANLSALFPVIYHQLSLGKYSWWFFLAQFLFILSITLPFDIRDFYKDYRKELKTIPGVLGIKYTRLLAYVSLIFYLLITLFILRDSFLLIGLGVMTFYMICRSQASKPDYYYTFLIDGLIIIQFFFHYFINTLNPN